MRTRGLLGSVAVTTGLLVTVALASRRHPLSDRSSLSGHTVDLLMVAALVVVAVLIVALAVESRRPESRARRRLGVGDVLLALVLLAGLAAGSYGVGRAFHSPGQPRQRGVPCATYERAQGKPPADCEGPKPASAVGKRAQHSGQSLSWLGIGTVVALLVGGGALYGLERRRPSRLPVETDARRRGRIVDALDLSIDDLRHEPDARRAIIAAYARMETAFASAGVPRRPSEAPHEYVARSLRELDTSAGAATRLTDLFELAKFGRRPPTLTMRDEAIETLLVVRGELTAPERAAASATESGAPAVPTT